MALWHGYIGVEDVSLTAPQRAALVAKLRTLGQANGGAAQFRMQLRVRNDGLAAIFEATFDDNQLTVAAIKSYLATIFNIDPATISHTVGAIGSTPYVTYIYSGQDKLRVAVFAGTASTWEESRQEAMTYLALHSEQWGTT